MKRDGMMMTIEALRSFTVDEYHKMAEMGLFDEDEPIELLQGHIVMKAPKSANHSHIRTKLTKLLVRTFGDTYDIGIQNPVILSNNSEPEPDAAVMTRYQDGNEIRLPTPADVFLLIEVSDSTCSIDYTVKMPLYAAACIPELWIVDVSRNVIDQFHTPDEGVYTVSQTWQKGDTVPTTLGVGIAATDILI